ncbi:hypothetical protein MWN34_06455 [Ancylobacter sp. 6x-1]|uniref:DUF2946 domain-containing protein n=1 Tax=Ancylobacter crimeensis TaxID=2579147 RepID=A0ABT0D9C4_9HYPH|nr:DUF2946 family protein [Ancylobacter crimeensis]MCK0196552.1 hypothetical protein [Ancylobacter crimeensis]
MLGLLAVLALLPAPLIAATMSASPAASDSIGPMPCHEGMVAATDGGMKDDRGGALPAPHLCCALACLVAAPPVDLPLSPPARVRVAWDAMPVASLIGRSVDLPEPPPRPA